MPLLYTQNLIFFVQFSMDHFLCPIQENSLSLFLLKMQLTPTQFHQEFSFKMKKFDQDSFQATSFTLIQLIFITFSKKKKKKKLLNEGLFVNFH